jgi:ubiquinone/menaquinone biosynthesis C-methylase UbiE
MKDIVKEKYGKIAETEDMGGCGCGCGCGNDDGMDYSVFKDDYDGIAGYVPEADLNLGCGLPTEYAGIKEGDTVIDLGSGAGNDCFIASQLVGATGEVIGIDMTAQMIERARINAEKLEYTNVKFRLGEIENMPVTANKADVLISNCVINLVPDKYQAFREMMRVLKPGGHFCISDVVTEGVIPQELLEQAELYAGCVAGAMPVEVYLDVIRQNGFKNIDVKKKKRIDIPEAILNEILTEDQLNTYKSSGVGLYSITVTAEKPSCLCGCK